MPDNSEKLDIQLTKNGSESREKAQGFISTLTDEIESNGDGTKTIYASIKISKDGTGTYVGKKLESAIDVFGKTLRQKILGYSIYFISGAVFLFIILAIVGLIDTTKMAKSICRITGASEFGPEFLRYNCKQ